MCVGVVFFLWCSSSCISFNFIIAFLYYVSVSSGSVVVDMTLVFNNQTVIPSTAEAEESLQEALDVGISFLNVISGTIVASKHALNNTAA